MSYCNKVGKHCLFKNDKFCCGEFVEPPKCYHMSSEKYLAAIKNAREEHCNGKH